MPSDPLDLFLPVCNLGVLRTVSLLPVTVLKSSGFGLPVSGFPHRSQVRAAGSLAVMRQSERALAACAGKLEDNGPTVSPLSARGHMERQPRLCCWRNGRRRRAGLKLAGKCPGECSTRSGDQSLQAWRFLPTGQRARNLQPRGVDPIGDTSPERTIRWPRPRRSGSGTGTADTSEIVYG